MIDVITFRGTGEPQAGNSPVGMLKDLTKDLDSARFRCFEPVWRASIGPVGPTELHLLGPSLDATVAAGVSVGLQAIRDSPNVCGLLGYSLGAICTSRILEAVAKGDPHAHNADGSPLEIAFIVNIASPLRRRGESIGDLCPDDTYGLHGEHGAWPAGIEVAEYANPKDMITAAGADSLWRVVNAGVSPFSLVEGGRIGDIIAALFYLAAQRPDLGSVAWNAIVGALGYLAPWPDGEHVLYSAPKHPFAGTNVTWTRHAADYLNANF